MPMSEADELCTNMNSVAMCLMEPSHRYAPL